jgi:hypothetical protein
LGYWARGNVPSSQTIPLSKYVAAGSQLGCTAQASATLFADIHENSVEAESGRATDSIALKIDSDAKQVSFLTAAAVRFGATDGDKFVIVYEDDRRISAVHVNNMGGISALIVIKSAGLVIWTKATDTLFASGQAFLLQCI